MRGLLVRCRAGEGRGGNGIERNAAFRAGEAGEAGDRDAYRMTSNPLPGLHVWQPALAPGRSTDVTQFLRRFGTFVDVCNGGPCQQLPGSHGVRFAP